MGELGREVVKQLLGSSHWNWRKQLQCCWEGSFTISMPAVLSNCKLALALNYPHTKSIVCSSCTWDLPAYFSLVLMGVSMYKSSSLPPLLMWNRCQESFLHFRWLIGFRWNTKARLWPWAHSSSTRCTPGFINTHGTSCLICCHRSGQKQSFCCAPLHPPPKPLKITFIFSSHLPDLFSFPWYK